MKLLAATALGMAMLSTPVFADGHATGNAEAGEKVFNKCKACHMIQDAEGTDIVKGGRTGPNLYGLYTRVAGSTDLQRKRRSQRAAVFLCRAQKHRAR